MWYKKSMFIMLLFVVSMLGSTGCGAYEPHLGVSLQFLDANLLKQVRFVDLALFKGDKISCEQLNPSNYKSTEEPIASVREKAKANEDIVSLMVGSDAKVMIDGLLNGRMFLVYVVALTYDVTADKKKVIAHGCVANVTLINNQTTVVPIKLKAPPEK
jgi:hypothetical protein